MKIQALVRIPQLLTNCCSVEHLLIHAQDITTRGQYVPDRSMATAAVSSSGMYPDWPWLTIQNPPLYLHVTATSKESLEKAVEQINQELNSALPNLVDERRFRRRDADTVERDEYGRVKRSTVSIEVSSFKCKC